MLRLAARSGAHEPREQAGRFACFQRPNPAIDSPTRAARLTRRSAAGQPHMAQFRFSWHCAMIDPSIHDQATAHATSQRDVENRVESPACAVRGLSQSRNVRVVVDDYRSASEILKPFAQLKVRPAFNVM